jgi:hypothetical protein
MAIAAPFKQRKEARDTATELQRPVPLAELGQRCIDAGRGLLRLFPDVQVKERGQAASRADIRYPSVEWLNEAGRTGAGVREVVAAYERNHSASVFQLATELGERDLISTDDRNRLRGPTETHHEVLWEAQKLLDIGKRLGGEL